MSDDPDPSQPSISLAPVVEVRPSQNIPGIRIHPPEHDYKQALDDLWDENSDLMRVLAEANRLAGPHGVARHGLGDPAGEPIIRQLKMYYRVLVSISRDNIPLYQYEQARYLIDEIKKFIHKDS